MKAAYSPDPHNQFFAANAYASSIRSLFLKPRSGSCVPATTMNLRKSAILKSHSQMISLSCINKPAHMDPRTIATINQLEEVEWFTKIGLHDCKTAKVLSSWPEAIEHCSSLEWENLRLGAANLFCMQLARNSLYRFNQWNDIVREVKKTSEPFVEKKIRQVVEANQLPKAFENCVRWDILHLLMEAEYADVIPPAYYAGQAYWYLSGHFPCGWEGKPPDGRPIVY